MSISHREFLRLLPKAIPGKPYINTGDRIIIRENSKSIEITLARESSRTIASLTLPVTNIAMKINGYSEGEINQLLRYFDLAYQKGGG